jgi:hypothetical protein
MRVFRETTASRFGAPKVWPDRTLATVIRTGLLFLLFGILSVQSAYAGLTVTPTTWNVVGLDSNNLSSGPDTFQVGARVCNTGGSAVTNIVGNFIWDIYEATFEVKRFEARLRARRRSAGRFRMFAL